jgi:uncharacterized membrane protein
MLLVAAGILGALAAAGVGAVINSLTGAAIGAALGAVVSRGHMAMVMRQASPQASPQTSSRTSPVRTPAAFTWMLMLAALFCGLMAGFFFAFSFLVMRALEVQPDVAGMPVMQTINIVVFNPVFGIAFSAAPAFCVFAMNIALVHRREAAANYALAGGALYLVGTLYVTVFGNVPLNDALAAVSATSSAAPEMWATYLREWVPWNHLRTAAAFVAAGLLTVGVAKRQ